MNILCCWIGTAGGLGTQWGRLLEEVNPSSCSLQWRHSQFTCALFCFFKCEMPLQTQCLLGNWHRRLHHEFIQENNHLLKCNKGALFHGYFSKGSTSWFLLQAELPSLQITGYWLNFNVFLTEIQAVEAIYFWPFDASVGVCVAPQVGWLNSPFYHLLTKIVGSDQWK